MWSVDHQFGDYKKKDFLFFIFHSFRNIGEKKSKSINDMSKVQNGMFDLPFLNGIWCLFDFPITIIIMFVCSFRENSKYDR